MYKKRVVLALVLSAVLAGVANASDKVQLLKSMFHDMVIEKNISKMPQYYTKDFVLYSNGKSMSYQDFYQGHQKVYQTPIQYSFQYDDGAMLQSRDKLAARVFITTKVPGNDATKIEVILIAQYRGDKICRLWELTYPDWSKLKSFKSFSK